MKTLSIKIAILFVSMLIVTACSTSSVSLDVLEPAQINLSQSIQKVGIVNRSLPGKGSVFNNILEGLLSGESVKVDKQGSESCITGLAGKLNDSPRFAAVTIYGLELGGTGTGRFPTPLGWGDVDNICKKYEVDAIIVLETFDSDVYMKKGDRMVDKKIDDRKVKVREFFVDVDIDVNSGWRIYNGKRFAIVDENRFTDRKSFGSKGDTPEKALSGLPDKRKAINDAGYNSGIQYARRISPTWSRKTRQYYTSGNELFKDVKQYVKNGNWETAMNTWKTLALSTDPKIAGRACYNMALACEMEGNLDLALTWANKSLKKYNNKKASSYINILSRRKMEQQRLDEQLGN